MLCLFRSIVGRNLYLCNLITSCALLLRFPRLRFPRTLLQISVYPRQQFAYLHWIL